MNIESAASATIRGEFILQGLMQTGINLFCEHLKPKDATSWNPSYV